MVYHKPWRFFISQFEADDGKHKVAVGAPDLEEAIESIRDMYANIRDLRIRPRVNV